MQCVDCSKAHTLPPILPQPPTKRVHLHASLIAVRLPIVTIVAPGHLYANGLQRPNSRRENLNRYLKDTPPSCRLQSVLSRMLRAAKRSAYHFPASWTATSHFLPVRFDLDTDSCDQHDKPPILPCLATMTCRQFLITVAVLCSGLCRTPCDTYSWSGSGLFDTWASTSKVDIRRI